MTPEELLEEEVAKQAEAAARPRPLLLPPVSDESPFTQPGGVISGGTTISPERGIELGRQSDERQRQRQAGEAAMKAMAGSPLGKGLAVAGEYGEKAAGNLMDFGGAAYDAARSIPPYALSKLEQAIGTAPPSESAYEPEKRLAGQLARPVWDILGKGEELWRQATSTNAPPKQLDITIPHDATNTGEQFRRAGENFGVAMDPSFSTGERFVSGLTGLARSAINMGNPFAGGKQLATEFMPGQKQLVQFASREAEPLGGLARARRGVLNLGPGPHKPEDLALKKVIDKADEIAGVKRHDDMDLPQKKRDDLDRMIGPIINEPGGFERFAAMTPQALEAALRDNLSAGRIADKAAGVPGRTEDLGGLTTGRTTIEDVAAATKKGTPRSPQNLSPEDVKIRVDKARELIDAHPGGPPSEALMIALHKVPGYRKGKGNPLGELLEKLGGKKSQNKADDLDEILNRLSERVAQNETKPTTAQGRAVAEAEDVAKQAEDEIKVLEPETHPVVSLWNQIGEQTTTEEIRDAVAALQGKTAAQIKDVAEQVGMRFSGSPSKESMIAQLEARLKTQRGDSIRSGSLAGSVPSYVTPKTSGGVATAPASAPPSAAPGGGATSAMQGQALKPSPVRTSTPPAGAWQGVNRPGPPTVGPPTVPATPRRPPVQGPRRNPNPNPERQYTGAALNHVDTLENAASRGGNAAGRKLAEDLREIINDGESSAARPVAGWNDAASKVSRNPKALAEISDVGGGEGLVTPAAWERAGAGNWKVGRFQANVDGNAVKMGIRPEEVALTQPESRALVQEYWKRMAETGYAAEKAGVKTASGRLFNAKVKRFNQRPDPAAKEWMVDGNPEFQDFIDEARLIYPYAEPNALRDSLKAWAAGSLDRPAAFEFERTYPMLPAVRTSRRTGEVMPVIRHEVMPTAINPEGEVPQLVRSQWMRLAGIKRLGQDVTLAMADDPRSAAGLLDKMPLGKALAADPATAAAARKAIGAVYGRAEAGWIPAPVAETKLATSRNPFVQGLRAVVSRGVPALNLGLQGIKSIPQTLGEVPAMTGAANYAKAVARVASKHGLASEEARLAGALHEKFLVEGAKVFDRHRLTESVLGANVDRFPTERLNDFVKDLNDTIAFTAGKFKAEEMVSKGARRSDFLMMDEMNLPQSVQDVFRNPAKFDDAARSHAIESFGRRLAQETQFHSKNRALKGAFENDQWGRYVIPYMQYSVNTLKRTYRDFERVWRMSGEGVNRNSGVLSQLGQRINPFGEARDPFRNAVRRLVTRTLGMEAAGEMIGDVSAALQGNDPTRRDRSKLARFLENLKYASFLGPLQVIADQLSAHVLSRFGGDTPETIKAFQNSKPIELQNPAIEAATKVGMDALRGDLGGAAYEATVGQSPLVKGVGRASGAMEPLGARPQRQAAPRAGKGFFDDEGTGKKGFFDEEPKRSKRGFFDEERPKRGGFFD